MKSFLEEYYYIPKHTAVPESNAFGRIGISIGIILLCLVAMSFSAMAFFSHNISSAKTSIASATYSLQVVKAAENTAVEENGAYRIENDTAADKEYSFTVSVTDNTTASVGYCKIAVVTDYLSGNTVNTDNAQIQNAQLFYTDPIYRQASVGKPSSRTVAITVPAGKSITVYFITEWGTCAKTTLGEESAVSGILFKEEPVQSDEQNDPKANEEESPSEEQTEEQTDTPSEDVEEN